MNFPRFAQGQISYLCFQAIRLSTWQLFQWQYAVIEIPFFLRFSEIQAVLTNLPILLNFLPNLPNLIKIKNLLNTRIKTLFYFGLL